MSHLELIPKARDLKLILLDIDGTLVRGSEMELDNVRHQLGRLRRFGVRFSVATGRTIYGASAVLGNLDPQKRVKWLITYNGAVVARRDARALIEWLRIGDREYSRVLDICDGFRIPVLAYACSPDYHAPHPERVYAEGTTLPNEATDFNGMSICRLSSLRNLSGDDVVAMLAFDADGTRSVNDLATQLRKACGPTIRVATSGGRYVEIANRQATKQWAAERLCSVLAIQPQNVMAIGDNYNDMELLSNCGISAAVANSPQEVKDVCDYVCRHDAAAGVVEVLRWLADTLRDERRRQQADH
jgi:Cof subfamily protein (haloacid dehalogenase superfamily)